MPELPDGEQAPPDGSLPDPGVHGGFAAYVHIPFCAVRCGYCDFNTYTNLRMGPGASVDDFPGSLAGEIALSRRVLRGEGRLLDTAFFGGGTPTMLDPGQLGGVLAALDSAFGLRAGAEVTTEANPESVSRDSLLRLADAGFTRASFGMQSAVGSVLAALDRRHTPGQVERAVAWARQAGLDVSVDLIYGAPGESMGDWRRSLEAAIGIGPDHISAYALVIEEGTRMWGRVRRGELPMPGDDDEAAKYEVADAVLAEAGYRWYEISNWARPGAECRHNEAYWRDWDWYGAGPGAHSHLGDVRMWDVKHPVAWAGRVAAGRLPVAGHEVVDARARELERVMLGIRMREGLELAGPGGGAADGGGRGRTPEHLVPVVARLVADGLLQPDAALRGRAVLTLRGRLMADAVTRALV